MALKEQTIRWINFHEKRQHIWGPIFLVFIALAFVLSDWTFAYFSFAEFIFMVILPIMFVVGQYRIKKYQVKWIIIPVILITLSSLFNYLFNVEQFYLSLTIQATIKFTFYLFVLVGLFNYINRNQFEKKFLNINNILALVTILIGIGITLIISFGLDFPFRFLWTFTRQDYQSYLLTGVESFVRTRSIFSEPAHFGYYLNILIASNLFGVNKLSIKRFLVIAFMLLGVLLTFSYSMIFVSIAIIITFLVMKVIKHEIQWSNWYFLGLLILGILIFVFWDGIQIAIIDRTAAILSGEDGSAYNRLVESWKYVEEDTWWHGNGINNTPVITNNFAYMLSDLGLFGFIPSIIFTLFIFKHSITFGVLFVLLNFSRGGYLGPAFWLMMLFILVFIFKNKHEGYKKYVRRL